MLDTLQTAAELVGIYGGRSVVGVAGKIIDKLIGFINFTEGQFPTDDARKAQNSVLDGLLDMSDAMDRFFGGDGSTPIRVDGPRLDDPAMKDVNDLNDLLGNLGELVKDLVPLPDIGDAVSDFSLILEGAAELVYKDSTDHEEHVSQVSQGLIASGGGWELSFDANKLNLNQYQGTWIDNTFTAAATQILADGYRPGNGNTVKEVFDFSLRDATQGLSYDPNKFGALLNSGNAQARLTLPTDPLVLDLNGDGVR